MDYTQENYQDIAWNELHILRCYLCGSLLRDPISKEHVIPQTLFPSNSPHRPAVPAHSECNRLKSLDDHWFAQRLYIRAQNNPVAQALIEKFLDRANLERPIIDKSDKGKVRHFKLANTLMEDVTLVGKEDLPNGIVPSLRFGKKSSEREADYIRHMAEGLCLSNFPFIRPKAEKDIIITQYSGLRSQELYESYKNDLHKLFFSKDSKTVQQKWGGYIRYAINPKVSMVWIEFFEEVGFTVSVSVK